MVAENDLQYACRAFLRDMPAIATTGSATLGVSATGGEDGASAFVRAVGSFKTDGFKPGMEIDALGTFDVAKGNGGAASVLHVTPLVLSVAKFSPLGQPVALQNETAAAGRSLVVGLPKGVSWENILFNRTVGRPHIVEQWLPGGGFQKTNGFLEITPMWILTWNIPFDVGIDADAKYTDAVQRRFKPGTRITLANPVDDFRVRRDIAPRPAQRQFVIDGFVTVTFTIPLRLLTENT
jgi:hypothetical protein